MRSRRENLFRQSKTTNVRLFDAKRNDKKSATNDKIDGLIMENWQRIINDTHPIRMRTTTDKPTHVDEAKDEENTAK